LYSGITKAGVKTIFRNDRLWIAGDHRVDPRNYNTPLSQKLIGAAVKAEQTFKLTDYKGSNYTIMHTEFVRERATPGSLVIGADSHTCSSGAVGALAIGLGVADVAIPVITGETWFKVPECINISFVGDLVPGMGGKDVILHLLKRFKRNTIAANRIIEFSGPSLKHLSIDA
jgi:homoaconitase/3-isopropylmalate dehydratase large subunit